MYSIAIDFMSCLGPTSDLVEAREILCRNLRSFRRYEDDVMGKMVSIGFQDDSEAHIPETKFAAIKYS